MGSEASARRPSCISLASRHELGLCALLLASLAFPQLVAADASPAEREIARTAMQAGDQLRDAGDLQGALQRYRSANAIMHVPTTGLAVARTEAELRMLVEARSSAMEVINLPGAGQESAIFAKARADAIELAAKLEPLVPSVWVEVSPSQIAYTIELDGDELPGAANGLMLKANPGSHVILVRAEGYQSQRHELALSEAETSRLSVSLEPVPSPVVVHERSLRPELVSTLVASQTPAATASEGAEAAPAPPAHSMPADAVGAGKTRALVGLTAGGVFLLAGAATGIASFVKTARIEPRCDDGYCGEGNRRALQTANTLANIANVTVPLGVLGLGYAVYEYLRLQRPDQRREHAAVAGYWLAPDTVGVRW